MSEVPTLEEISSDIVLKHIDVDGILGLSQLSEMLLIPDTLLMKLIPKMRRFRFLLVDRFGQAAVSELFPESERLSTEFEQRTEERKWKEYQQIRSRKVGTWEQRQGQSSGESSRDASLLGSSRYQFGGSFLQDQQTPRRSSVAGRPSYAYSQLVSSATWPDDVDPARRELYLEPADFTRLLGVNYQRYRRLPEWRKTQLKQAADLF